MARISTYSVDGTVDPNDIILGTDSADANKTKNFKASTFASFSETNAQVTEELTRTLTLGTDTLLTSPPASITVNTLTKGSLVYFDTTFEASIDPANTVDTDYAVKGSFTLPMEDYEPASTHVAGLVQIQGPFTDLTLNEINSLYTSCFILSGQGEADTKIEFAVYVNYSTLVGFNERFAISGVYQI